MRWKKWISWLAVVLLAIVLGRKLYVAATQYPDLQWDLELYLDAARGWHMGVDPYAPDALFAAVKSAATRNLHWLYPPHHLAVFSWLNTLGTENAKQLWFLAKTIAAVGLLSIWWRHCGRRAGVAIFLLCAFFAFRGPLFTDMRAGNVTVFEQLFLWLGLLALLSGRKALFPIHVFLAAQWKWTLSFFMVGAGFFKTRRAALVSVLVFILSIGACLVAWTVLGYHVLVDSYLHTLTAERQSEWQSITWDGGHFTALYTLSYIVQSSSLGLVVWTGLASIVVTVTAVVLKPFVWMELDREKRLQLICFLFLVYGLLVPRFKDYSALILAPALMEAWIISARNIKARVAVLVSILLVSIGGTIPERTDWIARVANGRFLLALLVLWLIYAYWLYAERRPSRHAS